MFPNRRCKLCRAQVPDEGLLARQERSASPSAAAVVGSQQITRSQVYAELPGSEKVIDARRDRGQTQHSRAVDPGLFEALVQMTRANFIRQMENLLVAKPPILAEIADQRGYMGTHSLDSMLANPDLASSLDAEDRIRLMEAQNILTMMAGKLGLTNSCSVCSARRRVLHLGGRHLLGEPVSAGCFGWFIETLMIQSP